MKLAHLRTLPRLKVGEMGWPAALFFGAAIAESDSVLRLSTGATRSLKALREIGQPPYGRADFRQLPYPRTFLNTGSGPKRHVRRSHAQSCEPRWTVVLAAPLGRAWLGDVGRGPLRI